MFCKITARIVPFKGINQIKQILADLKKGRKIIHGWLGVRISNLSPKGVARFGRRGVLVTEVIKNGPAERAGLMRLDLVIAVNRYPVFSKQQLINRLYPLPVGTRVSLRVLRKNQEAIIWVRLGKRPGK